MEGNTSLRAEVSPLTTLEIAKKRTVMRPASSIAPKIAMAAERQRWDAFESAEAPLRSGVDS